MVAACSSSPDQSDSGTDDAGNDAPIGSSAWKVVVPKDGATIQAQTVAAFWFESETNGLVAFSDGLVEHFASPTTIDTIALDGSAHDGDTYLGFITSTPLGIVVRNRDGSQLVTSADKGKTFTYQAMFKTLTAPSGVAATFPLLWLGTDKTNAWHVAISAGGGDVYSSSAQPGPTVTLTDTWHPTGAVTVPATIPSGDCTDYVVDTITPNQPFAVTTDGSAMVYASGTAICHSSDDGKTFVDVSSHITPSTFTSHPPPLGFLFTSATAGIAYYGSDLDNPGTAYVLTTSDGGDDWIVGTLPAIAASDTISLDSAFASPSGTLYMVGGSSTTLLLFKSTDAGKTWTDIGASVTAAADALPENTPVRLVAGFALDDHRIWVGSDSGFIAYTATGGQ
jgi:hypothetical protein